jgi:hypothetical protein
MITGNFTVKIECCAIAPRLNNKTNAHSITAFHAAVAEYNLKRGPDATGQNGP